MTDERWTGRNRLLLHESKARERETGAKPVGVPMCKAKNREETKERWMSQRVRG